jgi:hypothetical protein
MVDLAATQTQAKGVSPSINQKEGQTKADATKPLNMLSPPLPTGWTSCTASWWSFTPLLPHSW